MIKFSALTSIVLSLQLSLSLCSGFVYSSDASDNTAAPLSLEAIKTQVDALKTDTQPFSLNVYFDNNSAVVKAKYITMLKNVISAMADTDSYTIEITIVGHTDDNASNNYNQKLGNRRAKAVSQLLSPQLKENFTITSLTSQGEENPLNNNHSKQQQALNRRVTIIFSPQAIELNQVTLSGSGSTLLVNEQQRLVIWDTQAQCPQSILPINNEKIYASAIAPNGRLALSGGEAKQLTLWDMATTSPLVQLAGHQAPITALAFSTSSRLAISGSMDRQVKLWDLTKQSEVFSLQHHRATVTAVALSDNGKYAASADSSGEVILWNLLAQAMISSVKAHKSQVSDLKFTSDNNTLISSGQDQQLHLWQLADQEAGKKEQKIHFNSQLNTTVTSFDISADNRRILAAYENGHLIQWSIPTRQPLMNIDKSDLSLMAVSYLNKGSVIMAIDTDRNIHFWDSLNGNYIENFTTQNWEKGGDFPDPTSHKSSDQPLSWLDPHTNMPFIWVAPACYDMGCGAWNKQCSANEKPVHQVCNEGYWIAQHEVSQQQWQNVMGYNPAKVNSNTDCNHDDDNDEAACVKQAVNQVSWFDTKRYLCNLNRQAGQVYRLPTESEWEFACRNGGETIPFSLPVYSDEDEQTINVDNHYPLFSMNNGVWEWTLDAYDDASYQKHQRHQAVYAGENSYHFMAADIYRALRGGSWDRGATRGQCSTRHYDEPQARTFFSGFRLVKP